MQVCDKAADGESEDKNAKTWGYPNPNPIGYKLPKSLSPKLILTTFTFCARFLLF